MEWAKMTYHTYYSVFDRSAKIVANPEVSDHWAWMTLANTIQSTLRKKGENLSIDEMLRLAKLYKLKMNSQQEPQSRDDILEIFRDKQWYKGDIEANRKLIWNLTYGIYRKNNDVWAVRYATTWMADHKIEYDIVDKDRPDFTLSRLCF